MITTLRIPPRTSMPPSRRSKNTSRYQVGFPRYPRSDGGSGSFTKACTWPAPSRTTRIGSPRIYVMKKSPGHGICVSRHRNNQHRVKIRCSPPFKFPAP